MRCVRRVEHFAISLPLFVALACSVLNRDGPTSTCRDLGNGATTACQNGIIASCIDGQMSYQVCAEQNACNEPWQVSGSFVCDEGDPLPASTAPPDDGSTAPPDDGSIGSPTPPEQDSSTTPGAPDLAFVSATVVWAGNGFANGDDAGVVEPGDTADLKIILKNAGTTTTGGDVIASLTTSLSTIDVDCFADFGVIDAGATACGDTGGDEGICNDSSEFDQCNFSVPVTVAPGTTIPFVLNVTDLASDATYSFPFTYTIGG